MDIVVIGGAIGIVGFFALIAAVPMWGNRTTRRLWVVGVGLASVALAILFWRGPPTGPGWFVVINDSAAPVIAQMRGPAKSGHAYLIEPRQFGPFDYPFPYQSEIWIFTADCRLLGTSQIEGRFRGTVVLENGSIEIHDLGDMGSAKFEEVDRCPLPSPSSTTIGT